LSVDRPTFVRLVLPQRGACHRARMVVTGAV